MGHGKGDPDEESDDESQLLERLAAFLECVLAEAPFAAENVEGSLRRLEELIAGDAPVEERDRIVLALLGMYGGMGSANDFPWSRACEAAKNALFDALVAARALYLERAGGVRHNPDDFERFAVGARVRLVVGRTYYIDPRGRRFEVDGMRFPADAVWEIQALYPPDVSGMPAYAIVHGNHHLSARHEALELVL